MLAGRGLWHRQLVNADPGARNRHKARRRGCAIPHLVGSAQRYWMLRRHVDRRMLLGFGLASAAGGLAGALVHTRLESRALGIAFGLLLVLAAIAELTGWMERVRWGRRTSASTRSAEMRTLAPSRC
jgi:uncharacterized membrane protein YfcA